jgi:hypothetical protein
MRPEVLPPRPAPRPSISAVTYIALVGWALALVGLAAQRFDRAEVQSEIDTLVWTIKLQEANRTALHEQLRDRPTWPDLHCTGGTWLHIDGVSSWCSR